MNISAIQFIIVLYKQALGSSASFLSLQKALEEIGERASLFVYDNSPEEQKIPDSIVTQFLDFTYVHDAENRGLSVAYNLGAEHARMEGKQWLFLLDQDTKFPSNALKSYLKEIAANPDINLFAPILQIANGLFMSPCHYKYKWGKLMKSVHPGMYSFENTAPVNSGICVNLNAFLAAGGYNERIRLDGADYQFIERFKKNNTRYLVLDVCFHQDFSLFDNNTESLLNRFSLFLADVKNFERETVIDDMLYARLAFVRMLNLFLQTKNLKFPALYWSRYLWGKNAQ
jgi:GT2 family glycosyltransferase